jgi:hypothetical protein
MIMAGRHAQPNGVEAATLMGRSHPPTSGAKAASPSLAQAMAI